MLHLVDIAPLDPGADPVYDARAIVGELEKHDPSLAAKPRWLVLNKLDLIDESERQEVIDKFLAAYRTETGYAGPVFTIAAIKGDGTRPLIFAIQEQLEKMAAENPRPTASDLDDDEQGDADGSNDDPTATIDSEDFPEEN